MKQQLALFPAILVHGDVSLFTNVSLRWCFQAPSQN